MSEIQKPFARWESFADCKNEQMQIGHSEESANKICGAIQARAEKGLLYKALPSLEILKSEDNDLIVGGPASWEIVDPENDYVTTQAMLKFLTKFFQLPSRYRNVSIDHDSLIMGEALLQYPENEPKYFTHVHEKGMYLLAKIRDDTLSYTQYYRRQIMDGTYKMFSIRGKAIEKETVQMNGKTVRKIYDIDPIEVAIVKEGMNPKAGPLQILKSKCPPCIEHLKNVYVSKGFNEKEALDMAEKLFERVYERMEKEDVKKPMTWEECIAQASKNPDVTDPEKLCGWLRAHGPNAPKKTLDFQHEAEQIFYKHFPEHKR